MKQTNGIKNKETITNKAKIEYREARNFDNTTDMIETQKNDIKINYET